VEEEGVAGIVPLEFKAVGLTVFMAPQFKDKHPTWKNKSSKIRPKL
jgi:hypothetical protein